MTDKQSNPDNDEQALGAHLQRSSAARLMRRLRHLLMLLLGPVVIGGGAVYFYLQGGRIVATDNAYVKTDILTVSSFLTGQVTSMLPHDSDRVSEGQLLFRVDDQPYKIALTRAEANLANVRGDIESLREEFTNKQLEIDKAQTDLAFRERELARLGKLNQEKSISEIQYDQAVYERDSAQRLLAEKQQALNVVKARLIDASLPTDEHPRVRAALAELEKARFDLQHVEVFAPADGVVVNISAHVGENVIGGAPVMSLVSDKRVWMEANFKETDLRHMLAGQSAEIHVDTFPDETWHGHVASITPATGSEFSLLPAQNSSGNWVKVVQRVRVLIEFDDYAGQPSLVSGMSASVEVDTGHERHLPFIASN